MSERDGLFEDTPGQRAEAEAQWAHLHTVFSQAPTAIAVMSGPEHRVELINALYQQIVGTHRPVLGRPIRAALPELQGQEFFDLLDRVYATGEAYVGQELEARLDRLGDGTLDVAFFNFVYAPRRGPDGRVEGVTSCAFEVTELVRARRKAEALARDLEIERARFEAVLQQMPSGVIVAEAPSGRVALTNLQVEEILGHAVIPMEGFASYQRWRAFHLDGRPYEPAEYPLARALQTGEVVTDERLLYFGDDGARRLITTRAAPVRDPGGAIVAGVVLFDDVTARSRLELEAEEAARRTADLQVVTAALSEARTPDHVVDVAMRQGIAAFDAPRGVVGLLAPDGQSLDVVRMAGYPDEVVSAWVRVPMAARAPLTDAVRERDAHFYETPESVVARFPHLAGARAQGDQAMAVIPLGFGDVVLGAMAMIFTQPRRFEAGERAYAVELGRLCAQALERARLYADEARARGEAEAANRSKDEWLAMVSHELRSPLNAILGWVRLLRADRLSGGSQARALETIERSARNQAQLIEDLLDVSRMVAGQLRLTVGPVELASVVGAALDTIRPAAEAKGVRLEAAIDPDASAISGDAGRLLQVVGNLLSNAVKFGREGGRVGVALRRVGDSVELVVEDDGRGIEPAFLPHVFDRFKQQESGIARAHGGLGLGLSIVRHVIELHGGTIRAESGGPDRGATFVVRLPATRTRSGDEARPPEHGPQAAPGFECPPELRGLRVLVVDDEDDARALVTSALTHCGAVVAEASSAAEALVAVREAPPAVVVSDLGMPGGTGYDLIREVRALPPSEGGRVPAVALSSYARLEDRTRALEAGFNAHVAKPFKFGELLLAIANLAGRP